MKVTGDCGRYCRGADPGKSCQMLFYTGEPVKRLMKGTVVLMACERRCGCAEARNEAARNDWDRGPAVGGVCGCASERREERCERREERCERAEERVERREDRGRCGCRQSCCCGQGVVCAFEDFTRRVANGARTILFGCGCHHSCGCRRR